MGMAAAERITLWRSGLPARPILSWSGDVQETAQQRLRRPDQQSVGRAVSPSTMECRVARKRSSLAVTGFEQFRKVMHRSRVGSWTCCSSISRFPATILRPPSGSTSTAWVARQDVGASAAAGTALRRRATLPFCRRTARTPHLLSDRPWRQLAGVQALPRSGSRPRATGLPPGRRRRAALSAQPPPLAAGGEGRGRVSNFSSTPPESSSSSN